MIHEETIEQYLNEATQMLAWMKEDVRNWHLYQINEKIPMINVYMARSAEMMVWAKYMLTDQEKECDSLLDEKGMTNKTERKKIITYKTCRTRLVIEMLERINHGLSHYGDNLRQHVRTLEREFDGYSKNPGNVTSN